MYLSVVMPAYQAKATLPRAIDSFLASADKDRHELIIVFDGMEEDEAFAIAEGYAKGHPNIRPFYPRQRMGAFKTRQYGIERCTGEYCSFLDADDYFPAGALNEFEAMTEEGKVDIVNFSFYISTSKKDQKNFFVKSARHMDRYHAMKALFGDSFIRGFLPCKVIRRSLLNEIVSSIGTDVMFEDTLICVMAFAKAERFYYTPKPLYHYTKAEGETASSKPRTNRAMYHLCAFASCRLYLERLGDEASLKAFFSSRFRSYLSILYDLSQDRKFGLGKAERKTLAKEFDAIFDPKVPLLIEGTSYREHLNPLLLK